jgi:transposase InsO family protein
MGSTSCCYDNAVAGAFFASLKRELVRCRSWFTRKDLQSAVFDDVEGFYSTRGPHSTLGYASPAEHAHATSRASASAKAVQALHCGKNFRVSHSNNHYDPRRTPEP